MGDFWEKLKKSSPEEGRKIFGEILDNYRNNCKDGVTSGLAIADENGVITDEVWATLDKKIIEVSRKRFFEIGKMLPEPPDQHNILQVEVKQPDGSFLFDRFKMREEDLCGK